MSRRSFNAIARLFFRNLAVLATENMEDLHRLFKLVNNAQYGGSRGNKYSHRIARSAKSKCYHRMIGNTSYRTAWPYTKDSQLRYNQ